MSLSIYNKSGGTVEMDLQEVRSLQDHLKKKEEERTKEELDQAA